MKDHQETKEKSTICEVLRLLRISKDLSIKELSEKAGISQSYISSLEQGKKTRPSIEVIDRYSKALQVSKSTIMFFEEKYEGEPLEYPKLLMEILEKTSSG